MLDFVQTYGIAVQKAPGKKNVSTLDITKSTAFLRTLNRNTTSASMTRASGKIGTQGNSDAFVSTSRPVLGSFEDADAYEFDTMSKLVSQEQS